MSKRLGHSPMGPFRIHHKRVVAPYCFATRLRKERRHSCRRAEGAPMSMLLGHSRMVQPSASTTRVWWLLIAHGSGTLAFHHPSRRMMAVRRAVSSTAASAWERGMETLRRALSAVVWREIARK